jgi:Fe-Mn family superoxide dismutase
LSKFPELASLGLVDLNKAAGSDKVPAAVSKAVINQGGGALNHALFWEWMVGPTDSNGPSPALKGAIEATFGSVDEFKAAFNAAAASVFGSGWAWLVLKSDGKLAVTTTPNQVNPLMASVVAADAGIPILGLDVWEHAYYLKYQNKRPEYIASWWNVVNWERASAAYEAGLKGEVLL